MSYFTSNLQNTTHNLPQTGLWLLPSLPRWKKTLSNIIRLYYFHHDKVQNQSIPLLFLLAAAHTPGHALPGAQHLQQRWERRSGSAHGQHRGRQRGTFNDAWPLFFSFFSFFLSSLSFAGSCLKSTASCLFFFFFAVHVCVSATIRSSSQKEKQQLFSVCVRTTRGELTGISRNWCATLQPLSVHASSLAVAENMADLIDGYCRLENSSETSLIIRPNKGTNTVFQSLVTLLGSLNRL